MACLSRRVAPRPVLPGRTTVAALVVAVLLAGCGPRPDALRERAREALVKGDLRVAEDHAKKLLQDRPDDPDGRAILAEVYTANDDPRSAEKEWLRALEAGYDPDRGVPGLLAARVSNGDAVGALDAATRYRVVTPASRAAVDYWVGRAHLLADRPAQAEASWRTALDVQPDTVGAQVGLLGLRANRGETTAVLAELDALLVRAPRQPDALLLKADLQRARKDVTGARRTLEQAVAASPTSVSARAALVSVLVEAGDLPAAQAAYTVLRERAPRHPMTRYLRALIDVKLERLDSARDELFAVLELTPDDLRATALAAQVALRQDAIEQAETFARRILDRAPGSKDGATILATVALRRGEPDRALQVLRATLERSGDDATLLALAGEAALRGDDAAAAIGWFERATRLDPADAAKRSGLGLALLAAGRADAGFAALEAAVELDVQSAQADLALITARLRASQHVQALAAIDRLQRKQPRQALPHNLRGTALLARGDFAGARAAFEAALKLEPTFFPAAANLAELDLRERKPGQARGRLEALARAQPGDVRAGIALAQLLGRTGASNEDVIAVLRRTAAAAPRSNEAVIALARALIDADRSRDAVPLLQDLLARQRDDRGLIELLSSALLRAGEPQQAVETFERAVRLDPASPFAHLRLAELRASIGDAVGAQSAWRSVADLELKVRSPEHGLAATMVRAGRRADIPRVAATLRQQAPSSPAGYTVEGDLAAAEGRWLEAASAYARAIDVRFGTPLVIKRHRALLRAGRASDAEAALRDALRIGDGDIALRMYAGEQAVAAGKWRTAIEHYDAVVAIDPNHVVALNNLAWSLREARDPRALPVAEDAWRRAPNAAQVADTLGTILTDGGDAARGLSLLKRAMDLAPDVPQYRLKYAQALARQGASNEARAAIEPLLRDFPGSPQADAARALSNRL